MPSPQLGCNSSVHNKCFFIIACNRKLLPPSHVSRECSPHDPFLPCCVGKADIKHCKVKTRLLALRGEQFQRPRRGDSGFFPECRISLRAAGIPHTICNFDRCTAQQTALSDWPSPTVLLKNDKGCGSQTPAQLLWV